MNPPGNKNTLTFDEALIELSAKKSWDTLIREGVDPTLLRFWLRDIADSPDRYGRKSEDKRKALHLAQASRKLATEIERSVQTPPILFFGAPSDLQTMLSLPKSLRAYASYWEKLLSLRWPRGTTTPRTDRAAALLEIIKKRTGTYRYQEVADVLNAMDATSYGIDYKPRWDVSSLRQLIFRAGRRLKRISRD